MNSGNQGLETLAALCGGVSRPTIQDKSSSDNFIMPAAKEVAHGIPINKNKTTLDQQQSAALNEALLSPNLAGQQWLQYLASINGPQATAESSLPGVHFNTTSAGSSGISTPNNLAAAFCQWMYNIQGQYQPLVQAMQATQLAQQLYQQQQQQQLPLGFVSEGSAAVPSGILVPSSSLSRVSECTSSSYIGSAASHHFSKLDQQTDTTSFQDHCVVPSTHEHKEPVLSHSESSMVSTGISLPPLQLPITQPAQQLKDYAGELANLNKSSTSIPKNFVSFTKLPEEKLPRDSAVDPLDDESAFVEKKELKRAANRRSAQLSRKRKKHFVEELKEENDDLRRKEQILRSVPDLIVMFDSAGRLGFVSHSVSNFLDFKPSELEGTSFWHRLCDDSVRLLKAAFMDALASRVPDLDTSPLGDGLWELRLKDKDGSQKLVTLNGVVHFSGDRPECVCSMRLKLTPREEQQQKMPTARNLLSDSEKASDVFHIKPEQRVVVGQTEYASHLKPSMNDSCEKRRVAPISDVESNSESGSDRF